MSIERWDRLTGVPLTATAIAFLVAFALPIMWPALDHPAFSWIMRGAWVVFLIDFVVRLALVPDRLGYVLRHPLDVAAVVLPLLRVLRLLALVPLQRVFARRPSSRLRGSVFLHLVASAALLGFCAALATLRAERGYPGANITTVGDSLWWALTTMTTVGYGDLYPVSTHGRIVASGLMLGGITIVGTVSAMIASWMIERTKPDEEVEALRQELAETKRKLDGEA